MKNKSLPLVILVLALAGFGAYRHFSQPGKEGEPAKPVAPQTPRSPAKSSERPFRTNTDNSGKTTPKDHPADPGTANSLKSLTGGQLPKLSHEQIEAFLAKRNRNASALLAAFRLSGDAAYLHEAGEKHAADPRVQLTLGMSSSSPEEKQRAFQELRKLAPDNALADYLLAMDSLRGGKHEEAVASLTSAYSKKQMNDYSAELAAAAADAYESSGFTELQSKLARLQGAVSPLYSQMAQLSLLMTNLQTEYRQGGDADSANALCRMGLALADQLQTQPGHSLMSDLVGMGVERRMLQALPPETVLDDQGGTAKSKLEALEVRKTDVGGLGQAGAAVMALPEQEALSYFNRFEANGEAEALRWLKKKHGDLVPQQKPPGSPPATPAP